MNLTILFFGAVADAVGTREVRLQTDEETTVGLLMRRISQDYPSLTNHKLFTAVNEEHASSNSVLKDGDEVAIFTAVSGG